MVPVSRELTINALSDFNNSFIVAIHLRCGRIFSDSFTAKFPTDCASERVFNLSIFDDDMNKSVVYLFSDSQCISPEKNNFAEYSSHYLFKVCGRCQRTLQGKGYSAAGWDIGGSV